MQTVYSKLYLYARLIRFEKPVGTLLLLWPTLIALWLANRGAPHWDLLVIFIAGVFLMRSAGCVINDIADRNYDQHVARTVNRVLASRSISLLEASIILFALILLSGCLLIFLNHNACLWAILAVLMALTYPYTKRFFVLPQLYLGLAFGCGIPMAFAATQNTLPMEGYILWIGSTFWTLAYDTEYALVDKEDDLKIGIHTAAITLGKADIAVIMLSYGAFLLSMAWLGWRYQLNFIFWTTWILAITCVIYHYFLIRKRIPQNCFKAFLHNQWVGALLFTGVALSLHF